MASLTAQRQIADSILAPYFHTIHPGSINIVDDGDPQANPLGMHASQAQAAVMQASLQNLGLGAQTTPEHWLRKGREIATNPRVKYIRCDGCAALVLHLLHESNRFTASLHLVEQGRAGSVGHWFVVADQPGATPTYPDGFSQTCFVIDLWGTSVQNQRAGGATLPYTRPTVHPPHCVFETGGGNALTVRQSWGGEALTLP